MVPCSTNRFLHVETVKPLSFLLSLNQSSLVFPQLTAGQFSTVWDWSISLGKTRPYRLNCSGAEVHWCRGALVQRCSGAEVQWCRGAVVQRCSGAEMQWYRGAVVQRCSSAVRRAGKAKRLWKRREGLYTDKLYDVMFRKNRNRSNICIYYIYIVIYERWLRSHDLGFLFSK
jgi:hypothetical protein